eukprot:7379218-Prymnesium_polylepis.1
MGNLTGGKQWESVASKAVQKLRDDDEGSGWWKTCGMHASADAINAGFVNESEAAALKTEWFSKPLQLASLSPFESYFMLKALFSLDDADAALFLLHRQWGGMLDTGATTTWERFDPQFADSGAVLKTDDPPVNSMNDRTSMCHPWSSGATPLLSRHGLGLTAATRGFAEQDARPKCWGCLDTVLTAFHGSLELCPPLKVPRHWPRPFVPQAHIFTPRSMAPL